MPSKSWWSRCIEHCAGCVWLMAAGQVERDIGPISVTLYNLGAQIGHRALEDTSLKTFELGWRMGCEGLFRLAKSVASHCHWGSCAPLHRPDRCTGMWLTGSAQDDRKERGLNLGYLCHCCCAWQSWAAFTRGCYGWTTDVVPGQNASRYPCCEFGAAFRL